MSLLIPIDIETLPDQREGAFDKHLAEVKPPANYKKPESIEKWIEENGKAVADENYRKTALNGTYGEICSISWSVGGDISSLTQCNDFTEKDLLAKFWLALKKQIESHVSPRPSFHEKLEWAGHNVEFDMRFIKQRCIINQVRPVFDIPADSRHGAGRLFCTMKEWSGIYGNRFISQDALCEALGIGYPDWADDAKDVDGSKVWDLWQAGEYDLVAEYNRVDVWRVQEIIKKFRYE